MAYIWLALAIQKTHFNLFAENFENTRQFDADTADVASLWQ